MIFWRMAPPNAPPDTTGSCPDQAARTSRPVAFISALTVVLVTLLGLASFTLSFEALWHFAHESGALSRERAWLFPLVVDGAILVFSISALRSSIVGDDTRWAMSLVVFSTLASVVFNIAHAPRGVMPALIGATPPVLLFLSFESLLRQINSSLGGREFSLKDLFPAPKRKPAPKPRAAITAPAPAKALQLPEPVEPPELKPEDLQVRKDRARSLLSAGTSKREAARQCGLGIATVRRLALSLQPA